MNACNCNFNDQFCDAYRRLWELRSNAWLAQDYKRLSELEHQMSRHKFAAAVRRQEPGRVTA